MFVVVTMQPAQKSLQYRNDGASHAAEAGVL